ncbi:MAG TPA: hypothetical protein VGP38_11170, partial [Rubrobacter sp.]|nr:hypothetical protein [Rubrobacter sp.]
MRPKDLLALILLRAVWGLSFLFIRIAAPTLGPFLLMELRVDLATLALAPLAIALGRAPEVQAQWKQFLV